MLCIIHYSFWILDFGFWIKHLRLELAALSPVNFQSETRNPKPEIALCVLHLVEAQNQFDFASQHSECGRNHFDILTAPGER